MIYGTWTAYNVMNPVTGAHFGGSLAEVPIFGGRAYIALTAFVINLVIAAVLTVILKAMNVPDGVDADRGERLPSRCRRPARERPAGDHR